MDQVRAMKEESIDACCVRCRVGTPETAPWGIRVAGTVEIVSPRLTYFFNFFPRVGSGRARTAERAIPRVSLWEQVQR